jgi:hypothetical protein
LFRDDDALEGKGSDTDSWGIDTCSFKDLVSPGNGVSSP